MNQENIYIAIFVLIVGVIYFAIMRWIDRREKDDEYQGMKRV